MIMGNKPTTAIVQQAEETERQLVERAMHSLSVSNWDIGECAYLWKRDHAAGRSDEAFGDLVGIGRSRVQQCRQVWEMFADVRDEYPTLHWSHFYNARDWYDAPECLAWAAENRARPAQMVAWRRTFDDTTGEVNDHFEDDCHTDGSEPDAECTESTDVESVHSEPTGKDSLHVADADPYQKPPSNVVSTPRDFPEKPEKPAEPAEPVERAGMRDILAAIREAVKVIHSGAESRMMAFELRRLADEIEGAA